VIVNNVLSSAITTELRFQNLVVKDVIGILSLPISYRQFTRKSGSNAQMIAGRKIKFFLKNYLLL